MKNFRYAIIGTGALGGLYGAMLHKAGLEVHFLLHHDYPHVHAHGLRVDSLWGHFTLPDIHAYGEACQMPPCDVVCVCLKTTANQALRDILPHVARPGSTVLLMQNGLGAEEEVAALLPEVKVGGGLCYLCCNRIGPGHIQHIDYGKVTFGAHTPGLGAILETVRADFQKAGVPVELTQDLQAARWRKLVWNIPFNGLSVILHTDTDRMMSDPRITALAYDLMREVIAGARACGQAVEPAFADEMCALTRKMKPYRTSMALDFDARRALETEYIYRRPLRAARDAGLALPRIETLASLLEFLDAQRRTDHRRDVVRLRSPP